MPPPPSISIIIALVFFFPSLSPLLLCLGEFHLLALLTLASSMVSCTARLPYRLYIGHRRRHVYCAGVDVPVPKMTASARAFQRRVVRTDRVSARMSVRMSARMSWTVPPARAASARLEPGIARSQARSFARLAHHDPGHTRSRRQAQPSPRYIGHNYYGPSLYRP